jgi:RNA-directed DNA polymerase
MKSMREKTRNYRVYKRTDLNLNEIANQFNPVIRGWIEYYGQFNRSALYPVFRHFNNTLIAWARHKYKKLKRKTQAGLFIENISKRDPSLFAHWKIGMTGSFA